MCGLVTLHSQSKDLQGRRTVLETMLSHISHRGPDGQGVSHSPNQALFAHCRLAVIDLKNGAQPMRSEDGRFTLVFNGEIYNYLELAEELKKTGCTLKTASDTEVLLQVLIHRGPEALLQLNGMFAFVFHDRQNNRWIAARDHFGIKPLYYAEAGDELIFASEIKAILPHPEIQKRRNDRALNQYLCFQFCLGDQTLFEGIRQVRPGHYLVGEGSKILQDACYWDTNYRVDYAHTEAWFEEELLKLLYDSMRLQMRSDVAVGAYLSGGIDSSLVALLASKRSTRPLPMFHGRFIEGPEYDESSYAKDLARNAQASYHEVIPTAAQFVDQLPGLIYALDEPLAGPGLFPQFAVSKLARNHVKVVLGGQGGDEIFGGYARYLVGYLEQALKGSILETQEEGKYLVSLESIVPNLCLLKRYTPLLASFWSQGLFGEMDARYFHLIDRSQGIQNLLHPEAIRGFNREALFADFQAIFNHPDTKSYINKMTHFDQKTLLPALLQIEDRVSMAVSLESRVPLLDRRIVDLVTSIPPQQKFQGGHAKHVLKKAVRGLLPESILNRKDKMGFPVPLNEWMKGGCVRDFVCDILLSEKSIQRGIFKEGALKSMIENSGVGARALWGALSLELWHRRFIDGA
jgi:asparagine synthase (glutamine-hydrolysing)